MTPKEFDFQMRRLKSCFGENQFPEERCTTIFKVVNDLSAAWFQKLVNHAITSMNHRIDFADAARSERNHLAAKQFTKDVVDAFDKLQDQMTDQGLSNALSKFGAKSLLEAIENSKGKP